MNDITNFSYGGTPVRSMTIDGEPWFVAADVCAVLEHSDTSMAISRLDEDEKGTNIVCTLGGPQSLAVINESGLYSLILTSRKPQAKAFKKWVTAEVLPSIRKTGQYQSAESTMERPDLPDLSDPAVLQRLLADHLAKRVEAERRAAAAESTLDEAAWIKRISLCARLFGRDAAHSDAADLKILRHHGLDLRLPPAIGIFTPKCSCGFAIAIHNWNAFSARPIGKPPPTGAANGFRICNR